MEEYKVEIIGGKKRRLYPHPCEHCTSVFWKTTYSARRFCSKSCATKNRRSNLPAHEPKTEKYCSHCAEVKNRSCFRVHSSRYDGLQSLCRDCEDKNKAQWYRENIETVLPKLKARKKLKINGKKRIVAEYLLSHPCVDCGETDIVVLDFDHVKGVKKANIATLMSNQSSFEKLEEEIEKCVVRCANCHRRKTSKERNDWKQRLGLVAPR